MDGDVIRSSFVDRGVVRLDGAFSAESAAWMRDVVWRHAQRKVGLLPDDPSTWPSGWLPLSWKGLRRNHVFDAFIDNPSVISALDTVYGTGGWQRPKPGAQVLLSLPTPGPWTLPDGWHMDCGFERPTWPVFAVKLFAFIGEVGPCGGGTMLLPGSHRLVHRYRSTFEAPPAAGKANWHPFLRRHSPLGDLLSGAAMSDRGRSMVGQRYDIDGVPVDVVELTGEAGRRRDHSPSCVPLRIAEHERPAETDARKGRRRSLTSEGAALASRRSGGGNGCQVGAVWPAIAASHPSRSAWVKGLQGSRVGSRRSKSNAFEMRSPRIAGE